MDTHPRTPGLEWSPLDERAVDTARVLPPAVRARVAVEAGVGMTWHRYTGDTGRVVSLEHFGASADHQTLYREFGLTSEAVAQAARDSLNAVT